MNGLLGWIGIEPALAELPRLRKTALLAGNTQALIEYHIIHAKVSTMRGWLSRAEREAQIASDLLERSPHLIQSWKLRQLQSNAAIKRCDLHLAGSLAKDCFAWITPLLAPELCIGTTFGNLAHISVMSGDYLTARKCLDDALTQLDHTHMRIAAFSTGIELGLASGDQLLTANMVSRGESAATSTRSKASYYHQNSTQ